MSDALEEILSGRAEAIDLEVRLVCEEVLRGTVPAMSAVIMRTKFTKDALRSVAEEVVRRCEGMPLPRVHETWPKPYRVGWLDGAAAFGEALRSLFPTAFKEKA